MSSSSFSRSSRRCLGPNPRGSRQAMRCRDGGRRTRTLSPGALSPDNNLSHLCGKLEPNGPQRRRKIDTPRSRRPKRIKRLAPNQTIMRPVRLQLPANAGQAGLQAASGSEHTSDEDSIGSTLSCCILRHRRQGIEPAGLWQSLSTGVSALGHLRAIPWQSCLWTFELSNLLARARARSRQHHACPPYGGEHYLLFPDLVVLLL